jgi:hypothetical protein
MSTDLIYQKPVSRECRVAMAVMSGGLFLCLLTVFSVPPGEYPFAGCVFQAITGHSCFTCGLTRSLHAIAHGQLGASIRYHLFGPAFFAGILLCSIVFGAEAIRGKRYLIRHSERSRNKAIAVLIFSWVFYWGIRLISELSGN